MTEIDWEAFERGCCNRAQAAESGCFHCTKRFAAIDAVQHELEKFEQLRTLTKQEALKFLGNEAASNEIIGRLTRERNEAVESAAFAEQKQIETEERLTRELREVGDCEQMIDSLWARLDSQSKRIRALQTALEAITEIRKFAPSVEPSVADKALALEDLARETQQTALRGIRIAFDAKYGSFRKCPSCGAVASGHYLECSACGVEYQKIGYKPLPEST